MLAEKMVDEPDAGGAREVADAEGEACGRIGGRSLSLRLGDGLGEFVDLIPGRFGIGGGLQDAASEEVVKGAEAARLDEVVHDPAARAAEFFRFKAGLEAVPAMIAATLFESRGGAGPGG